MVPVLIACAHGTRSPAGQAVMAQLQRDVAAARPALDVRPAFLDVQSPSLDSVAASVAREGRPAVVVPLLLSTGYHVTVDVARAVTGLGHGIAAPALGPDPVLVGLLVERLAAAGAGPSDAVVLAAAGSSDPAAAADVEAAGAGLGRALGVPVRCGYLAAAAPTVAEAVAAARAEQPDRPVSVASYLLAPGHFSTVLAQAGADRVAASLAPAVGLTRLVLARYDRAAARLAAAG